MKRIFFSLAVLAFSYGAMAQEDSIVTRVSVSANPAYTAPSLITSTFRTTYPDVVDVTWAPMGDWWIATYHRNNRIMHTYYTPGNVSFNLALPVLNGMIPEDVITAAMHVYGNNVYDITRMKDMADMQIYQVRTLDHGVFNTIYIDQSGKMVTDFHTMMLNNNNPDMMNTQKETKVKMEDGTKIKVEDNKTKIKNKDQ